METKTMKLYIIVACFLAVSLITQVPAQAGKRKTSPGWVGTTTVTVNGSNGVVSNNILCAAQFSGSRMCNVKEILDTIAPPVDATFSAGAAWVQTSIEDQLGELSFADNCLHWLSEFAEDFGTVIIGPGEGFPYGQIGFATCDFELNVACCTLPGKK